MTLGKGKKWRFNIRDIDTNVRPQDDFFHYSRGNWIKRHPIPKNESRWGGIQIVRRRTDKQLRALVSGIVKARQAKSGDAKQLVRDFYRSGINLANRKKLGLKPVSGVLKRIRRIQTPDGMVRAIATLQRMGVNCGLWGYEVDQDRKNSERYIMYLYQSGLGMPDRDYYLKNDAESKRVRAAYVKHLKKLAALSGYAREAKRYAAVMMKIETALAKASMKKEDSRDVHKTYHKMSLTRLSKLAPRIDWKEYFNIIGAKQREVIVMQPHFFKTAGRLLFSISVEDWKRYLSVHIVGDYGSLLTPELERENFNFYGAALFGLKQMKPLWRRILGVVNGSLDEILGELYVKTYFSAQAKKKMSEMIDNLFRAYKARIRNLDWMSATTKKKALGKLTRMNRKIGYPDKWKSYKGLVVNPDEYVGNVFRASALEHRRMMRKLTRPVDRKEWFLSPQTVNAYYSFHMNEIVFPAAILQHPFFEIAADNAYNYGAIGFFIGHEITHGFDDQGSKFDGKGNLKTWWTKADRARFEKKTKRLAAQFDSYEILPSLHLNGKLTLGETTADLGGLSISYDAYQLHLDSAGRKTVGGYTPEQRFFLGFAGAECEKERPEFTKTIALTDPHAPSQPRVNVTLSNLPEFYAAFGVKKGDKLYREPNDRAKIW